jgi:hypothetical protein
VLACFGAELLALEAEVWPWCVVDADEALVVAVFVAVLLFTAELTEGAVFCEATVDALGVDAVPDVFDAADVDDDVLVDVLFVSAAELGVTAATDFRVLAAPVPVPVPVPVVEPGLKNA